MGNLFGETADDFVNATFIKAFDRAETFTCPTGTSAEEQKKRVIGWLFTILENLLRDSFKAEAREREFREHNVDVAEVRTDERFEFPLDQDSELPQLSPRAALAARFLKEELNEEDADLVRLSANLFDFARNEPVFDSALLKGVCERMELTPSGLRSRRKRIFERLRQYIDQHESSAR